ncbi:NAD(P)-dependent oxidoreductase [Cupriavidus sp. 30B13]|uniref:NAD(P)-dependent oxidoreductase n=1 Tax=Cupriavidus sp. 30B13 TaxID=3384241 RepID=UPI003B904228
MKIGFIGLGSMGRAIAANLLKGADDEVLVWNRSAAPVQELAALGARGAGTPAEAFGADVVFTMLADDQALREILLESGLFEQLEAPLILVNMATVSVAFATELAQRCGARGIAYVAAPVMGRPDAAAAARLNILAAGPADAVQALKPLFARIGQKTWEFGEDAPKANVVKLAVNFMLASAVETLAEASVLTGAYGIAPAQLLELITGSIFPGPVYQGYGALIAGGRYEPAGFKAALGLKDLRLALAAGDAVSVPLPVGSVVRDSLIDAAAHAEGNMDLAVLGQVAARRAGR